MVIGKYSTYHMYKNVDDSTYHMYLPVQRPKEEVPKKIDVQKSDQKKCTDAKEVESATESVKWKHRPAIYNSRHIGTTKQGSCLVRAVN